MKHAVPFYITLSHFTQRYTVCAYAVLFDITLSHFMQRYTVCMCAVLFDITLSHFTQRFTFCVLYCKWMQSNSQLSKSISQFHVPNRHRTGPLIIWLNYSCSGCFVSWKKTIPSTIWPCHSLISYAILLLIHRPALYLLIYSTSLYFWWWRPPIYSLTSLISRSKRGLQIIWLRGFTSSSPREALLSRLTVCPWYAALKLDTRVCALDCHLPGSPCALYGVSKLHTQSRLRITFSFLLPLCNGKDSVRDTIGCACSK